MDENSRGTIRDIKSRIVAMIDERQHLASTGQISVRFLITCCGYWKNASLNCACTRIT